MEAEVRESSSIASSATLKTKSTRAQSDRSMPVVRVVACISAPLPCVLLPPQRRRRTRRLAVLLWQRYF